MTSIVMLIACSSEEPKQASSSAANVESAQPPPPVPDPPPRYKRVDTNNDVALPTSSSSKSDGGDLQIKCGGREPYVCMMDDGTFRCSDIPCVPDCDRIGCLGGDTCTPCEGGFRCLAAGDHC
jgi:hypothetical protein